MRLEDEFYQRDARIVAQSLLGKRLVRRWRDRRLEGMIVETEAYCATGPEDLACHGSKNGGRPTGRTAVMFGPAGRAYVYFTYGMHWLFNIVTGAANQPSAVLIRAIEPIDGLDVMAANRPERSLHEWTNGPAKLTRALAIDQNQDGENLCAPDSVIWCEGAPGLQPDALASGPRIGLGRISEPWLSIPWRYWIKENSFVSRKAGRQRRGQT